MNTNLFYLKIHGGYFDSLFLFNSKFWYKNNYYGNYEKDYRGNAYTSLRLSI